MSKRRSEMQLTKDMAEIDRDEDDDDDRHGPPDPVKIASAQVLAGRKYVFWLFYSNVLN